MTQVQTRCTGTELVTTQSAIYAVYDNSAVVCSHTVRCLSLEDQLQALRRVGFIRGFVAVTYLVVGACAWTLEDGWCEVSPSLATDLCRAGGGK